MRIGTAEIYRAIDELIEADTAAAAAAVPSVAGAEALEEVLVVGQPIKLADNTPDVRVVLFAKLRPDAAAATDAAAAAALGVALQAHIRAACSPRHVPAVVLTCPDIPRTITGKKVEISVARALQGRPVTNLSALANPESLAFFETCAPLIDKLAAERE